MRWLHGFDGNIRDMTAWLTSGLGSIKYGRSAILISYFCEDFIVVQEVGQTGAQIYHGWLDQYIVHCTVFGLLYEYRKHVYDKRQEVRSGTSNIQRITPCNRQLRTVRAVMAIALTLRK